MTDDINAQPSGPAAPPQEVAPAVPAEPQQDIEFLTPEPQTEAAYSTSNQSPETQTEAEDISVSHETVGIPTTPWLLPGTDLPVKSSGSSSQDTLMQAAEAAAGQADAARLEAETQTVMQPTAQQTEQPITETVVPHETGSTLATIGEASPITAETTAGQMQAMPDSAEVGRQQERERKRADLEAFLREIGPEHYGQNAEVYARVEEDIQMAIRLCNDPQMARQYYSGELPVAGNADIRFMVETILEERRLKLAEQKSQEETA